MLVGAVQPSTGQDHSVARIWMDELLESIRADFARPTVHARNLFHASAAMYDAWAAYEDQATPFLLGQTVAGFSCPFDPPTSTPDDIQAAQSEALGHAAYMLLRHRFRRSPLPDFKKRRFDTLMHGLGYDTTSVSTDYGSGSPAALGNYIASCMIAFGSLDGANEGGDYANLYYEPANPSLAPDFPGNPRIIDRNRWQPLTLLVFIDQSGNPVVGGGRNFLSPEWGNVVPFSLDSGDLTRFERDGIDWSVYMDPGPPPLLDTLDERGLSDPYKWGFNLVSAWSSHLDPADGVMWDISPASIGNIESLPQSIEEYPDFYDLENGGDAGAGHPLNPHTGQPYEAQVVPRGDYARVLAEFWADGPESETPPGHWFTIRNYVSDHPLMEKRYRGQGQIVTDLEWDVKSYFTLGGAMHDAAIAAWSIKGYYDYIRPISALRAMADKGQATDPTAPAYSPDGIPLVAGFIEMVDASDNLAGDSLEHVDKVKVRSWSGPDHIEDPDTDVAGVDWILAENWWPYQRPSFVTPPFAGYVSGHSTYSRAAAEVLTLLTGDPFFPGGMGEFVAKKDDFLVFERGPSVDVVLQWATYRDASDQCSLSRIWGGIHPPADDVPGRLIGEEIGIQAFHHAETYFSGVRAASERSELPAQSRTVGFYPNPARSGEVIRAVGPFDVDTKVELFDVAGRRIPVVSKLTGGPAELETTNLAPGLYMVRLSSRGASRSGKLLIR